MMKNIKLVTVLFLVLAWLALAGVGQPPASETVYRTYAEAMADAKKWTAEKNQIKAEAGYKRAVELAKTDTEKIEAMLGYAAILPEILGGSNRDYKRYLRSDEAFAMYQEVLEMPRLPPAKTDEVRLAVADMVIGAATRGCCLPPGLVQRTQALAKLGLKEFARAEYGKLIAALTTAPAVKANAYIGRSKTYDTSVTFLGVKKEDVLAAVADLKAATEIVQAADEDKAAAYFEMVEIARRMNDGNAVAGAYDAITKDAKPEQKISAYKGLIEIMLGNNLIKASRDKIAEAAKLPGISNDQRAVLSRLTAVALMINVDPSDPAAIKKNTKAAIAELDRTVSVPKMTDEEKFKTYMATGEYLKGMRGGYLLAIDQLEKATLLPTIGADRKAQAQYEIGEAYRVHAKNAEAKAAYLKVSKVNPRYFGYAQQRIKEVDVLIAAPAKPNP